MLCITYKIELVIKLNAFENCNFQNSLYSRGPVEAMEAIESFSSRFVHASPIGSGPREPLSGAEARCSPLARVPLSSVR